MGLGVLDVRPFRLLHPNPGRAQRRHETTGWQARGRDLVTAPAIYLVTLTTGSTQIRAIAVGVVVGDSLRGSGLLAHEAVHVSSVARRLRGMRTARIDREPVLLTHPGGGLAIAAAARAPHPLLQVVIGGLRVDVCGIAPGDAEIVMADLDRRSALIADGHHRLAAAAAHGADCQAGGGDGTPDADCGQVSALVVDSDDTPLTIKPIHRVLHRRGPQPLTADEVVSALLAEQPATVLSTSAAPAPPAGILARSTELAVMDRSGTTTLWCPPVPTAGMPTSVHIVERAGAALPATVMRRLRETDRVTAMAQRRGTVAVLMAALTHTEIFDTIAAGDLLPVKATSFEPKLPSGVLIRPIEAHW